VPDQRDRGPSRTRTRFEIKGSHTTEVIQAEKIVIAVGTHPALAQGVEFDNEDIVTSDELLKLEKMPYSLIVVGGGVIGTEYASMFSALGCKVTLIEGRARLLDFVDAEITEALQYHLRQNGVTLRLGERVVKIQKVQSQGAAKTTNESLVEAVLESGKTLRTDCLLYAVGRQGATETLNLSAAGLTADDRGRIKVNEFFQTEVPHIYACGDVIGFPALASTSMEQGRLAACHMFGEAVRASRSSCPTGSTPCRRFRWWGGRRRSSRQRDPLRSGDCPVQGDRARAAPGR
jgi:NAD(P) transhydrogenase